MKKVNHRDKFFNISGVALDKALAEFDYDVVGYKKGDENITRKSLRRYGIRSNVKSNSQEDSGRRRYSIKNSREGDKA